MKPRQVKALQALFTEPTLEAAAQAAGVTTRTLREYMKDPEFKAAYNETVTAQLSEFAARSRQGLVAALDVLQEIIKDPDAADRDRIAAAGKTVAAAVQLTDKWMQRVELDELERRVMDLEERAGQ